MKVRFFYRAVALFLVSGMILTFFTGKSLVAQADTNQVYVSTSAELISALRYANPGDEIIVAPGEYVGALGTGSNGSGYGSAWFYSAVDGTNQKPITVRCEDSNNKPILKGSRQSGSCLMITGDYWIVDGLEFTIGQKGVIFDNSNNSVIKNCSVYNVQQEGIHLRDGSSYNLIENCKVYSTGVGQAGFGEGIYIGSDKGKWEEFVKECDYNIVRSCELGPNITAEHIDIKEGTTGTIIENCIMHGTGISGQNYADSFIDAKGNSAIVRNNTCYQEDNTIIVDVFQTHQQVEGWGLDNTFIYNTAYLSDTTVNIVNGVNNAAAFAYGNTAIPSGNEVTGNVAILDKAVADEMAGSGITQSPPENETSAKIEINGYQISTVAEGFRTVYSVEDPNSEVEKAGMLYQIGEVDESSMLVGESGVYNFEATDTGKMDVSFSSSDTAQSYSMTMKFAKNTAFYTTKMNVRAYARLKDGTYIYSDTMSYTVYKLASYLYQNLLMNNLDSHEYLYNDILSVVDSSYAVKDFAWNNSIVNPDVIE